MVEGVENFKYMGRILHQTDGNWPAVSQNIMRARLVWGMGGGGTDETGRGGTQGVRNFIQGGGTSGTNFWI